MSTAVEEKCFSLYWEIENSTLFSEKGQLTSPFWKMESSKGSAWWCLKAFHSSGNIGFQLYSINELWQPDECEMSLITSCEEVPMKDVVKYYFLIEKNVIFGKNRQSILPKDTLIVRCRIWEKTIKTGERRIRSLLQNVCYLWNIKGLDFKASFSHMFIKEESLLFFINMDYNREENMNAYEFTLRGVTTREGGLSFVNCKMFLSCVNIKIVTPYREGILYPTTWEEKFLINAGGNPLHVAPVNCQLELELVYTVSMNTGSGPVSSNTLSIDLQHLYKDGMYSDATIQTEGKSFSIHRSILATRSPVFRAMFEKDEVEARSGVVDIDDVDSDTVNRMLVFLYGDTLDGLQWEEASSLYYAADKYDVLPLKQKCSDILKAGVSVVNACDLLVMADKHSDEQLMAHAVDFISTHQKVVSSAKWDELERINPRLTSKITRQLFLSFMKEG